MRAVLSSLIWLALMTVGIAAPTNAPSDHAVGSGTRAKPIRVAILTPDNEQLGVMLTAELSKNPDIALVERAEIERVFQEKELADLSNSASLTKAGQLLNADVLFIVTGTVTQQGLTRPPFLPNIAPVPYSVRFVAAKSGVVFYSTLLSRDAAKTPEGISGLVREVTPFFSKIHFVNSEDVVKIALLGLHLQFHLVSGTEPDYESSANRLLAVRLAREPKIVVLERWNLDAAAFEKSLIPDDSSSFWTGSYLLEGRIVRQDETHLVAEVEIRGPGFPQPVSIVTPPAAGVQDMIEALVPLITQSLGAQAGHVAWDRATEGQNYLDLARWAFQDGSYQEAYAAEETARALGIENADIDVLKIDIIASLLGNATDVWTHAEISKDTHAGLFTLVPDTLDRLRELWRQGPLPSDPDLSEERIAALNSKLIGLSGGILDQRSMTSGPTSPDPDPDLTSRFREALRQNAEVLLTQDISVRSQILGAMEPFGWFPGVYGWFKSPEEAASFYQKLWSQKPDPDHPSAFFDLRRGWFLSPGSGWKQTIPASPNHWTDQKKAEFYQKWDALENLLSNSSVPQEQADGWFLRLNRESYGPPPASEIELMSQILPEATAYIWDHRDEAVGPDPAVDFVALGRSLAGKLKIPTQPDAKNPPETIVSYATALQDPSFRSFPKKFLTFLLQSGTCVDPDEIRAFCEAASVVNQPDLLTLAPQFHAYRAAIKNSPRDTPATEDLLDETERTFFSFYDLDPVPEKGAFTIPKESIAPVTNPEAGARVRSQDGAFLPLVYYPDHLGLLDPKIGTEESIPFFSNYPNNVLPNYLAYAPEAKTWLEGLAQEVKRATAVLRLELIAITPSSVVLADRNQGNLRIYHRDTHKWSWLRFPFHYGPVRLLPAPGGSKVRMLLALGFPPQKPGGFIFDLNPATNTYDVIVSSEDRPAKNNLDGRPGDLPLDFAVAPNGSTFYAVKLADSYARQDDAWWFPNVSINFHNYDAFHDALFCQDPATGTWNKLFTVDSTFDNRSHLFLFPSDDGLLVLTKYRLGLSQLSGFGQLLEFPHYDTTPEVLLSNPAALKQPYSSVPRWEMPADLAGSAITPQVEIRACKRGQDLWVLRWEQGSKKPIHAVVYRFAPGSRQPRRLALDLDFPPAGDMPQLTISLTPEGITVVNGIKMERPAVPPAVPFQPPYPRPFWLSTPVPVPAEIRFISFADLEAKMEASPAAGGPSQAGSPGAH